MVQIALYIFFIVLIVFSSGTNDTQHKQIPGFASNDVNREPAYLIDLNKSPPSDHGDPFQNVETIQSNPKYKSDEEPKQMMTRKDVNDTFASCAHRRQCPHWDFMTSKDKQWSRTRRNRYADPDEIRRAKSRSWNRTYRIKLKTDLKRTKALHARTNARRQAQLSKMSHEEKLKYYEKRRGHSQKSKAKMKEFKKARQRLTNEEDGEETRKRTKTE